MHLFCELALAVHLFGILMLGATAFGMPLLLSLTGTGSMSEQAMDRLHAGLRQLGVAGIGLVIATGIALASTGEFRGEAGFWFGTKLLAFATLSYGLVIFGRAWRLAADGVPGAEIRANGFAVFNLASLAVTVTATAFAMR